MNQLSPSTPSSTTSPRNGEENVSMYFEFGSSQQADGQGTFQSMTSSGGPSENSLESRPSRGGIRVSLACISCRSRHVKCGAEMPNCSRCIQEDKTCFYAKSRRGLRDRNAPRKRASMRGTRKTSPLPGAGVGGNPLANSVAGCSSESYTGNRSPSDASASPESEPQNGNGRQVDPKGLLDLYYNFFHKAHPFVLPRYYFLARLESDPESLKYLFPVMQYIGSLYALDISSTPLREHALSQLHSPSLPPNGITVIALLLCAIAMHSEDEFDHGRAILDRAIYMALEIRMNSRTFANMEHDPVVAENWRRAYWGLYITDSLFAAMRQQPSFLLSTIEANVELPCEECDYDGVIPRPRILSDYDARDFEDVETVFSSFTYLLDLCRISGSLLGLNNLCGKNVELAVANADAMLVSWRLHLPREKQGVVDKNEEADELLFQAHNLLQMLLVAIHRPLSRLYHSPIETAASCAPPNSNNFSPNPSLSSTSHQTSHNQWIHTRKTLEAAESAITLYTLPIPILQHSPLGICGIALSTLANLSACSYVLTGSEWYRTRDRVRLGLGGLKKFGEVWRNARRTEGEMKKIARNVCSLSRPDVASSSSLGLAVQQGGGMHALSGGQIGGSHPLVEEQFGWTQETSNHRPMSSAGLLGGHGGMGTPLAGSIHVAGQGAYNQGGFEDLAGIDYSGILENAQALSQVGS